MGLLSAGKESSEYALYKVVIVVGCLLLVANKVELNSLDPNNIVVYAEKIKNNTDEYIGAGMVMFSAIAYAIKRAVLKWKEISELAKSVSSDISDIKKG